MLSAFIDLKFPNASRKTLCAELLRGVGGLLINNNGKRFVFAVVSGRSLYIYDTSNNAPLMTYSEIHCKTLTDVSFSASGRFLLVFFQIGCFVFDIDHRSTF